MRKSSVIPLFLIGLLLVHQIIVPAVAIAPAVALGAGIVAGTLVGVSIDHILHGIFDSSNAKAEEFKKKYEELLQDYQRYKVETMLDNIGTFANGTFADYEQYRIAMDNIDELLQYSKNYAWSLIKYTVYKCKRDGKDCIECQSEVTKALHDYYKNIANNVVAFHNTQVESLQSLVSPLHGSLEVTKSCGDSVPPSPLGKLEIRLLSVSGYTQGTYSLYRVNHTLVDHDGDHWCDDDQGDYHIYEYKWSWDGHPDIDTFEYTAVNYTLPNLGIDYSLKIYKMSGSGDEHYIDPNGNEIVPKISVVTPSKTYEPYNYDRTTRLLDKIDQTYKQMLDNAVKYIQQIYSYNIDVSEVIDPYVLASFMSQQANETGYFAYYSAEMALLGLPTNITSAFTIELNGKEYTGYLFTDSVDVLKRNGTYTLTGYFITEDGQLIKLNNAQVKIKDLVNPVTGEHLNETHLIKYTSDRIDPNEIEEEFKKLYALHLYLQNLSTTVGGGGGGSNDNSWADTINDFWNNLDWQVKAIIVGGIAVGVIGLVARGRRGGINLISLGK